jgi:single-strand DNA-binding protein
VANFNSILIVGFLTRDVEIRHLSGDLIVGNFGIAATYKYGEKEETCFVDCTAFGKQAGILADHVQKGSPLLIQGRLRYETWDDKQGGKRSKHTIVIDKFQFLSDGRGGGGQSSGRSVDRSSDQSRQRPWNPSARKPSDPPPRDETDLEQGFRENGIDPNEEKFKDSDIPF